MTRTEAQVRERWAEVLAMRESGKTYREVGEAFGFSAERAKALCKKALAERERQKS